MNCKENLSIGANKLFHFRVKILTNWPMMQCDRSSEVLLFYISQEHPGGTYVAHLYEQLGFSMETLSGYNKVRRGLVLKHLKQTMVRSPWPTCCEGVRSRCFWDFELP